MRAERRQPRRREPHPRRGGRRRSARCRTGDPRRAAIGRIASPGPGCQTSMTWRPLYVPHTEHAACGSLGERHCGQATVATGVVFHCARRDRVLLRDIFRLGTATTLTPLRSSSGTGRPSAGRAAGGSAPPAARRAAPRSRGTALDSLRGTAGWSAVQAPPRPAAPAPGRSDRPAAARPRPRPSSRPWCCAHRHTAPGS